MRRRFIDLHTHSTASDGALPPAEVVWQADRRRLAAVALTDHDTTAGLAEARAAADDFEDLRFVAGIEVSAKFQPGTMHILGLGIDGDSPALGELARFLREARKQRNPQMVARLQAIGARIDMDDVLAVAAEARGQIDDGPIGRIHIAEAMRRKGLVRTTDEAFEKFIAKGGPAYVDRERWTPARTIQAIRNAGGVPVLAHPVQLNYDNRAQLMRIVRNLTDHGLEGIEAYHSDHSARQTRFYIALAKHLGLAITGGSDFHGPAKPQAQLGRPRVPLSALTDSLLQRLMLS